MLVARALFHWVQLADSVMLQIHVSRRRKVLNNYFFFCHIARGVMDMCLLHLLFLSFQIRISFNLYVKSINILLNNYLLKIKYLNNYRERKQKFATLHIDVWIRLCTIPIL